MIEPGESVPSSGPPAAGASSFAPPGGASEDKPEDKREDGPEKPKSRGWFVVLSWITLILFGIFVAAITLCAIFVPELREAMDR